MVYNKKLAPSEIASAFVSLALSRMSDAYVLAYREFVSGSTSLNLMTAVAQTVRTFVTTGTITEEQGLLMFLMAYGETRKNKIATNPQNDPHRLPWEHDHPDNATLFDRVFQFFQDEQQRKRGTTKAEWQLLSYADLKVPEVQEPYMTDVRLLDGKLIRFRIRRIRSRCTVERRLASMGFKYKQLDALVDRALSENGAVLGENDLEELIRLLGKKADDIIELV